jgi:hypothetical protein
MILQLKKDMSIRPDLFDLTGSIDNQTVDAYLEQESRLPPELLHMWREVGGGELFETETLLSPAGSSVLGDDIVSVNTFHHRRGLSTQYIVFHVGVGGLTAYDKKEDVICQLDSERYDIIATFPSLDVWYSEVLHGEYARRYGLE